MGNVTESEIIPLKYTYRSMPKCEIFPEGMKLIEGDVENRKVVYMGDIVYAHKSDMDLHLKLLRPQSIDKEEDKVAYPVVIHVQGSAYMEQDMYDHVEDLKEIAAAGYVVAIVEYRHSMITKMPGQIYDVKDAVRYVAKHAEELGIDSERMYLSGDSSGGHASAMCWATWPVRGLVDKGEEELPKIRAFMDFYGCVDFSTMLKEPSALQHSGMFSAEGMALGGAPEEPEMQERVKECNVTTYINKSVENAPLLIMHGNKDRLVPFKQSVELFELAKEAGKDVTFICVNNSDHGGSAFYCAAGYAEILKFLKTH